MSRLIELSDADRRLLNEILAATGMKQKELAERVTSVRVKQPWVSQMLSGSREKVDSDMLEGVANQLVLSLKTGQVVIPFTEERKRVAFDFLSRFTDTALDTGITSFSSPGGPVPFGASYYVKR